MAFSLTSAKLTGNPGISGWAQVHEFIPEDPEKLAARGHLIAVVATGRHEEGVDAVSAGRELLSRLHEEYFGAEGSAFAILEAAVKKVSEEFRESWGEVEIAAVTLIGDVVYSVAGGGAEVHIFRNGILAKILESTPGEVVSASGYPQEGDVLILGTKLFFETSPTGVLKAAIEGKDPESAVEALAPSVHAKEDTGGLGGAVISFQKEEETLVAARVKEEEEKAPIKKGPNILGKALGVLMGIASKVLPEKKIYVRGMEGVEEEVPQKRKMTLTVGAILLVLLVVSIGFGISAKNTREEKARYETRLTQAQHEFDEAMNLSSLNQERARELFANSRSIADSLVSEGVEDDILTELVKKLDENQGAILGEYKIEPDLFVDLSILSSGLTGDALAASSEMLFVLDKKGKRVVGINFASKKTEIVAGPDQVTEATDIAVYEDRAFILNSEGVFEIGDTKTKAVDNEWEGEVLIYSYAGNIYVVDKAGGVIWRYPGSGTSFSAKQNWFAPGVKPDLTLIKAVSIDGSIWLLSSSGKISKFSLGNPVSFGPSGVFPELVSPDSIYTNEELKYVYLLEKSKKRVVVLEKDGKYKAQYTAEKIGEATDLAVNEEEKRIIILVGDKLFSLEVKHL